jgi:hypothetical protein
MIITEKLEYKNGKYNILNDNGEYQFPEWLDVDYIDVFYYGFACVHKRSVGYNFINEEGKILFPEWFDKADGFYNGYSIVSKNNKRNFINKEGVLTLSEWVDYIYRFNKYNIAKISNDNKWNFINIDGKLLSSEWFDWVGNDFNDRGVLDVKKGDNYYKMDNNGNIINNHLNEQINKIKKIINY